MNLKPLGHRIVIRPDKPVTATESGIYIPEIYQDMPAMSGTVERLGTGPERDKRIRARTIARCLTILDEAEADHPPVVALAVFRDEVGRYLRDATDNTDHIAEVGQRVIFPMEAGHEIVLGERTEETRVIVSEDSILAVYDAALESVA